MKLRLLSALLPLMLAAQLAVDTHAACTIDTLGGLAVSSRIRHIEVDGTIAYLAAGTAGLVVVDVSIPGTPALLSITPARGYAQDIEVVGTTAYLVESDFVGSGGLRIFDVSSPSAPLELGATGTSFTGVDVVGSFAYATDPTRGLRVIDVGFPFLPFEVGAFDGPGRETAVSIDGSVAYLTVDEGSAASALVALDISVPTQPVEIGSVITAGRIPIAIATAPSTAYLAAVGGQQRGLVIADTTTPASPVELAFLETESARDVGLANGLIYLVSGEDPSFGSPFGALSVIDVSTPSAPVPIGEFDGGILEYAGLAVAPGVTEDLVYVVANGTSPGLQILRVKDCPDTLRSRIELPGGGETIPVSLTSAVEIVIYGSASQSVAGIDTGALTVGPPGATQPAIPTSGPTTQDVDMDGHDDLVFEFAANDLGLASSDQQACVESTLSGQAFVACDWVDPNEPPQLFATVTPALGNVPQEVSCNSRDSFDPEGAPLTSEWLFDDLFMLTGDNEDRIYLIDGSYSVTLTLTDDTGQTATQMFAFVVDPPIPTPSMGEIGGLVLVGVLLAGGLRRARRTRWDTLGR